MKHSHRQDPPILIVEDDVDIRATLALLLESEGYRVVVKENGKEALDYLVEHPLDLPFLILLDLRMPVMDGWEFHSRMALIPAFARITTVAFSAMAEESLRSRVNGFRILKKPFELDTLLGLVKFHAEARPAT